MDWNKQYQLQSEEPFFWLRQSHRLKLAADLVSNVFTEALSAFKADPKTFLEQEQQTGRFTVELDSFPVYVFLYGLAMENLAKGILVSRNPKHFTSSAQLTHGLLTYIEQCGLALTDKRRALLKEVEVAIIWKGRYPTPKKLKDWQLRLGPYGDNHMPGVISPDDQPELETMYAELRQCFKKPVKEEGTSDLTTRSERGC
jgi:hypothetical protein